MNKEELFNILDSSLSKSDALKKLGYEYCNGRTLTILEDFAKEVDFDLDLYKKRKEKFCICCGKKLIKKQRKFCSKSCAAKINNSEREHSESTKKRISESLKNVDRSHLYDENGKYIYNFVGNFAKNQVKKEWVKFCSVCGKEMRGIGKASKARKTCSDDCVIIAKTNRTYQNGSRKTIYYENKWYGKIILESSWEERVAIELDKLNIKWNRPKPLPWVDKNGKKHLYYPDFYLEDYDLYVDPKNPYCMKKDAEKMKFIDKEYKIIYGDIEEVIEKIKVL